MLSAIKRTLLSERARLKYRSMNVRFLRGAHIDEKCALEGNNSIGEENTLYNCAIGRGTYTGSMVRFCDVHIGRFCSIGSNVRNLVGRHPVDTFVTTHPAFFSKGKAAGFTFSTEQRFEEKKFVRPGVLVEIGNDVWIGEDVTIMDNVIIGDGAVIGANSLVTKNIAPYSINIGSPAKPVRFRFDPETIKFLLGLKWWNRDFEWIRDNYELFSDIDRFKTHYRENQQTGK